MKKNTLRNFRFAAIALAMAFTAAGSVALHASTSMLYPGDLTLDAELDVSDAVLLARVIVQDKDVSLRHEALANADVNLDGKTDDADLTTLLRILAKTDVSKNDYHISEAKEGIIDDSLVTAPAETDDTTVTTTTVTTATEPITIAAPAEMPTAYDVVLGGSFSEMTASFVPTETLEAAYKKYNMSFAVYSEEAVDTIITFAADDEIVGFYAMGNSFTAPDGYRVTEYVDGAPEGTGEVYAYMVLKAGYNIRFTDLLDRNDLAVHSKMNFYALNALRAMNGLETLEWDDTVAAVALAHSANMAELDFFEHNSPDGTPAKDRMSNAGIDWASCSENIVAGNVDPFAALNSWYKSPGHRKNMLSTKIDHVGIGFAFDEHSTYKFYGTQDFYGDWSH